MKKLNFNFLLKDLLGNEIADANAGKLLANLLSSDNGKNPMKFWTWAMAIFKGESIEVDGQDKDLLKTFITDSDKLTSLSKAQLLEVMNK